MCGFCRINCGPYLLCIHTAAAIIKEFTICNTNLAPFYVTSFHPESTLQMHKICSGSTCPETSVFLILIYRDYIYFISIYINYIQELFYTKQVQKVSANVRMSCVTKGPDRLECRTFAKPFIPIFLSTLVSASLEKYYLTNYMSFHTIHSSMPSAVPSGNVATFPCLFRPLISN